ncbi:MAG: hypothetical protein IJH91_06645 [Mogibacterium sp.]|nr:hypothetical protein [Mogibacterium sp.]
MLTNTGFAMIANAAVIILEIFGFRVSISERGKTIFAYYTQISNLITAASSVLFLASAAVMPREAAGAAGQSLQGFAASLRYLSTCMLIMTFLITLCVLVPMGGGFHRLMLSGNGLYHHTLCPVISVASYVLWEPHAAAVWLPVVVTMGYGFTMLYMNWKQRFDGPYPFLRVHNQSRRATVLWMVALVLLIAGLSLAVTRVAR